MTAAERARRVIESAGPGEPGKQATNSGPPPRRPASVASSLTLTGSSVDQSLSAKLLGTGDTTGGAAVERRETSAVKGVF